MVDLLELVGVALVCIGLALWSVPFALVVTGLVFVLASAAFASTGPVTRGSRERIETSP